MQNDPTLTVLNEEERKQTGTIATTPMKRAGQPQEIAPAYAFLVIING
ncbi:hypothetical protein [Paenibacillus terrigena]|nr:hypothetical protein [Paenibacillus terrigena]